MQCLKYKKTTVTAGPGAYYTNVTIATATENKQNNVVSGNAYKNVDLSFFFTGTLIGRVMVETYCFWFGYVEKGVDSTPTSIIETMFYLIMLKT